MHRLKKSRISDSSKGLTLLWPLQLLERPRQTDTSCGSATRQKINDHTINWKNLAAVQSTHSKLQAVVADG
jgi:hypothetical protein